LKTIIVILTNNRHEVFVSDIVLRTLAGLILFEMLGIAAKYDIKSLYFSTATLKNAV